MAPKIKYRSSSFLKGVLVGVALVIAFGLLYFSRVVIKDLREESRRFVTFYAETYAKVASDYEVDDFSFLFDEIIKTISFPVVISDASGEPTGWKNIEIPPGDQSAEAYDRVREIMADMDAESTPIDLKYLDEASGKEFVIAMVHFGDSALITRLKWLPLIEIATGAIFILLGLAGFQFIRSSERQLIWVGMAKETAHQLGTPLSSLMGWVEMLDNADGERLAKLLPEMREDVNRLGKVAERFSQIGTGGGLKSADVGTIVENVVNYLRKRLPQKDKQIEIIIRKGELKEIPVNKDLLEWALENLLKNSADAIEVSEGLIEVDCYYDSSSREIRIRVKDNGKGVSTKRRKDIFKPGYSTKTKGWGLGLSLTRRIIEDYHGGRLILLESRLAEGTTMEIRIPSGE